MATIPKLSTEWSISFQFRLTEKSLYKWTNIIHFTNYTRTVYVTGGKIPAVFILNDSKLRVYNAVNGNPTYINSANSPLIKLNEKHHVEIHQRYASGGGYRYFIKINGTEIDSVINKDARQFYSVDVYASDPWYSATDGFISDFQFTNFL